MNELNKCLIINLSPESSSNEILLNSAVLSSYIGGRGLASYLFSKRTAYVTDPLSPSNCIVISSCPFNGTTIPGSEFFSIVTKSPLTNTIFYNNIGGITGTNLKTCGINSIIIEGVSKTPVYIVIEKDGKANIRDAFQIKGSDPEDVISFLRKSEGDDIGILTTGIAGDNLVKIASVINEQNDNYGRGGLGCVMGSKKLKAVVVKHGYHQNKIADQKLLENYILNATDKIKVNPVTDKALPLYGTPGMIRTINDLGMLPVNNFKYGYSEQAYRLSGEELALDTCLGYKRCKDCLIQCGAEYTGDKSSGTIPDYDVITALGTACGIFDIKTIIRANELCIKYGLDPISAGMTIACAMELCESGKLTGENMKFGNSEHLLDAISKIVKKEGIGNDLAEGARIFSLKYNSPSLAMQVKGLELSGFDPRGAMGQALAFATSSKGGSYETGFMIAMEVFSSPKKIERFTYSGKPDLLALKQNRQAVEDSMGICSLIGYALNLDFYARFLKAITGIDYTASGLNEIGEKIFSLERSFNMKAGFSHKDDTLPKRFLSEYLPEGLSSGVVVRLDDLLDDYYQVRKWNKYGEPG